MLSELNIENVAVIENVNISFEKGFNVLTGETGAGKSIIIDSINMILGERSSKELIRAGKNKAFVQALFIIENEDIKSKLEEYDITLEENELLITREISQSGKNSCKINGRIISVSILKEIGKLVLNIHGQHDNQALLVASSHAEFLDKYCTLTPYTAYKKTYEDIIKLKKEFAEIKKLSKKERVESITGALKEINAAKIKPGEDDKLKEELEILRNSEKITDAVFESYELLYDKNSSIYDNMSLIKNKIAEISQYDQKLEEIYNTIEGISYEIEEMVNDLREYKSNLNSDPSRLDTIESRLELISKLTLKYGLNLVEHKENLENELKEIEELEDKERVIKAKMLEKQRKLEELGLELFKLRQQGAEILEKAILCELADLDMQKVKFKILIEKLYKNDKLFFKSNGFDNTEFLISTNPSEDLKPLTKIASGGELSRIMLALKTVLSEADQTPTLIFDEIDIGVSGRAAQKIAQKIAFLSTKKQILCITHLPQIAAMADNHYLIEKNIQNESFKTNVFKLSYEEKKNELARMLGGAVITETTLKNASEIIDMAKEYKKCLQTN